MGRWTERLRGSARDDRHGAAAPVRHPWEPHELSFRARRAPANPYAEVPPHPGDDLLRVSFTGVDGPADGRRVDIVGFWDGGRTWRARFAPPWAGTWRWEARSSDRLLDGRHGELAVTPWTADELAANRTRRGVVRVRREGPGAGHSFAHADGTPFLWVGDTWWNWTKRGIRPESFRRLVDDRAARGFTVGQLFVPGNGWHPSSQLLDARFEVVDLQHLRHVESMIRHANARGIAVWVNAWWVRERMDRLVDEERIARWWRYLVHRLGADAVLWVLAAEYNAHDHGGLGLDLWKRLGALVAAEDPYHRILGVHPTPPGWPGGTAAPQWSTGDALHDEPWLDYHQAQAAHGRAANDRIPSVVAADRRRRPPKPVVVTEPWYEFVPGDAPAADLRFGIWAAFLSGAAGHSYGGGHTWRAHVPEAPAHPDEWPIEPAFDRDTLDYDGARAMEVFARVLGELPWWALEPHPELLGGPPVPLCAAIPGQLLLAYLQTGDALQLDLGDGPAGWSVRWTDPATGETAREDVIDGAGRITLRPPATGARPDLADDWLVLVRAR